MVSSILKRYAELSKAGDPLEKLLGETFRYRLDKALNRSDRARGGRPPHDAVLMFKILVLQALYNLSDDQAQFMINDRLTFKRFLGLGLADKAPNANTIRLGRDPAQAGAEGQGCPLDPEEGQSEDAKGVEIAIPVFGYKNHISTDRRHGFIRRWAVSSAAEHDSRRFREVLDTGNTGSDVWADTAYRSRKNEEFMEKRGLRSKVHFRQVPGKPLSQAHAKANAVRVPERADGPLRPHHRYR